MKQKILFSAVLVALALLVFNVSRANAQTTAVGPYYAPPSWDQTLPSSTRFIVLSNMNSEAVLDRETGLVWSKTAGTDEFSWLIAHLQCRLSTVGNRKGWRLPTIEEFASLVDPSVASPGPVLPAGHPFQNVVAVKPGNVLQSYWTANTTATSSNAVYGFNFFNGGASGFDRANATFPVWCVRGGQGVNPQ